MANQPKLGALSEMEKEDAQEIDPWEGLDDNPPHPDTRQPGGSDPEQFPGKKKTSGDLLPGYFGAEDFKNILSPYLIDSPTSKPMNWPLLSMLYFTEMGRAASKPGANLIGAMSAGFASPLQYILGEQKRVRDEEAEINKAIRVARAKTSPSSKLDDFFVKEPFHYNGKTYKAGSRHELTPPQASRVQRHILDRENISDESLFNYIAQAFDRNQDQYIDKGALFKTLQWLSKRRKDKWTPITDNEGKTLRWIQEINVGTPGDILVQLKNQYGEDSNAYKQYSKALDKHYDKYTEDHPNANAIVKKLSDPEAWRAFLASSESRLLPGYVDKFVKLMANTPKDDQPETSRTVRRTTEAQDLNFGQSKPISEVHTINQEMDFIRKSLKDNLPTLQKVNNTEDGQALKIINEMPSTGGPRINVWGSTTRSIAPLTISIVNGLAASALGLDEMREAWKLWFKNPVDGAQQYQEGLAWRSYDYPIIGRAFMTSKLHGRLLDEGLEFVFGDKGFGEQGSRSRQAFQHVSRAIELVLRARSGAAVPIHEVKNYIKWYYPSPLDDEKTARQKLRALTNHFRYTHRLLRQGRAVKEFREGELPTDMFGKNSALFAQQMSLLAAQDINVNDLTNDQFEALQANINSRANLADLKTVANTLALDDEAVKRIDKWGSESPERHVSRDKTIQIGETSIDKVENFEGVQDRQAARLGRGLDNYWYYFNPNKKGQESGGQGWVKIEDENDIKNYIAIFNIPVEIEALKSQLLGHIRN